MRAPSQAHPTQRLRDGILHEPVEDQLAAEEPLEIRLNGRSVVVTMRTPGDDEELALGFLLNEGILGGDMRVARFATIRNPLDPAMGNIVNVSVPPEAIVALPRERSFHATSACGVCGQASLETVARAFPPVDSGVRVSSATLLALPARMREAQRVFDRTGGLHAAALFTPEGAPLALHEDIGRHNAVDKVVGWAARNERLPLSDTVLLVSGRAGFEVVQKAAAAGIPLVAAVGAPSSLAARLAEQSGVTLVGFLRGQSFNLYTHPERVIS